MSGFPVSSDDFWLKDVGLFLMWSWRKTLVSKIYVSSTYTDLKNYREAVYGILRKLRHDVIAMEDYVATDERPLQKCLQDVSGCNLYVGIFAWRYGYIPPLDNPEQQSITELEYRQAGAVKIPRLLF